MPNFVTIFLEYCIAMVYIKHVTNCLQPVHCQANVGFAGKKATCDVKCLNTISLLTIPIEHMSRKIRKSLLMLPSNIFSSD